MNNLTSLTINDIIYSALRNVNAYAENTTPNAEHVESAILALNMILDCIEENDGVTLNKIVQRQRTFEDSSEVKGDDDNYYRCIKTISVPSITTWVAATDYEADDCVYPSTENGYYYKASMVTTTETQGKSGGSEPTFPERQDLTITDNEIIWTSIPDIKPVTGKNYTTHWVKDDSIDSADDYAVGTNYYASSDFALLDDEAYICEAFLRHNNFDYSPIEIVDSHTFSQISLKWQKGIPSAMYIEHLSRDLRLVRMDYTPELTGPEGYVLHYKVATRIENHTDGSESFQLSDNWHRAVKWMLISEIQGEHNVEINEQNKNDRKAKYYYDNAKKSKKPKKVRSMIRSCF